MCSEARRLGVVLITGRKVNAVEHGNGSAAVSTPDAVHYTDGGGKAPAAKQPVVGATRVIPFFMQWLDWFGRPDSHYSYIITTVNGSPGIVMMIGGRVAYVYSFEASNSRIRSIYTVANPDKLKYLEEVVR